MVSPAFSAALLPLVLLGGLLPAPCLGVLRDLGLTADAVDSDHVSPGGSCESGCVRTVVDAVAISLGEVDCGELGGLRVENLLDHTDEDVMGGALNVVHYCSNAEGELMYQVRERETETETVSLAYSPQQLGTRPRHARKNKCSGITHSSRDDHHKRVQSYQRLGPFVF